MAELDRGLGQQQSCWRLAHMVVDTLATGVDLASPPSERGTHGWEVPPSFHHHMDAIKAETRQGWIAPNRGFSG